MNQSSAALGPFASDYPSGSSTLTLLLLLSDVPSMIARWSIGVALGTLLVAITSPLFVRSYLPRVIQAARGVRVMQPGSHYRWRSEGYATTKIGELGMPGRDLTLQQTTEAPVLNSVQLALWGDSQAEGACVADRDKIGALVNQLSSSRVDVLSFARSGDDCNDWLAQIDSLRSASKDSLSEFPLSIDMHVFLIVELSDWTVASSENDLDNESFDRFSDKISATLPAFVIQAARNVLTSGTDSTFSQLRFRPGPVAPPSSTADSESQRSQAAVLSVALEHLDRQLARLHPLVDVPVLFLYCPTVPSIHDGTVDSEDSDEQLFQRFRLNCQQHGFSFIDYRPLMIESVQSGHWPRGFHNGQFGVGHYNALGNRLIASELLEQATLQTLLNRTRSDFDVDGIDTRDQD